MILGVDMKRKNCASKLNLLRVCVLSISFVLVVSITQVFAAVPQLGTIANTSALVGIHLLSHRNSFRTL